MSKIEILEELPKLTKTERQEIRLRLAELDSEDWLDDEEPLTVHERAVLDARLAAYTKDRDAGSTWEEVEGRIRARIGSLAERTNHFQSKKRKLPDISMPHVKLTLSTNQRSYNGDFGSLRYWWTRAFK